MSRIGKKPIVIPSDVIIQIKKNLISIQGPYGCLEKTILDCISIEVVGAILTVKRNLETKEVKAYHGLIRNLIANSVQGVKYGVTKILIAEGVGYKFQLKSDIITILAGFTHPITFKIPSDLTVALESPIKLKISGIDKEKVNLLASKIHNVKPPEPYKGKGIHYEGEKILRKAGKTRK